MDDNNEPITKIIAGDVVIVFNFRTDRCRQITSVLTQHDFPEFEMFKKICIILLCRCMITAGQILVCYLKNKILPKLWGDN